MRRKLLTREILIFSLAICLFLILWDGSFATAAEQESALLRIQRTRVIRVGWALWFPWMVMDDKTKKLTGMGPDIVEELAKALGDVKIEWVADNWATLPAGLQANKFDLTFPLGVTYQRALAVEFTNDMMREAMYFMIKKKDTSKFKSFEDVDQPGVKVCTTLGSYVDTELTPLLKKAEYIRYKSSPEGLMALVVGRSDVWANAASALLDAMKAQPDVTVIKKHWAVGRLCIAVPQGDQVFLNFLNVFVAKMKETGRLEQIYKKYGQKVEIFFD